MPEVQQLISTKYWIQDNGLKAKELTHDQILKKIGFKATAEYVSIVKKKVKSRYSKDLYNDTADKEGNKFHLTGGVKELVNEETGLCALISNIQERINWLRSGSREAFGVVTEKNILIVIDSYERSNAVFGTFCDAVAGLLREQIIETQSYNVIRLSDIVTECFNELQSVSKDSLRKGLAFVLAQQPCKTSERTTLKLPSVKAGKVDGIYLIVQGSPPSQHYLYDMVRECNIPLNTCLFGAADPAIASVLTEIAANSGGRWHHFSEKDNEEIGKLLVELDSARDVLAEITALRLELQHKGGTRQLLTVPPVKTESEMSSAEWLKLHGLRSNNARFYDVLGPQSFRHCNKVLTAKDGDKIVNAIYCQNFAHVKWWSGDIKHVIINQNFYDKYKSKIENIISITEKRINWMEQSSKSVFGTLLEDNVCVLLDASQSMEPHLSSLKKKLEKLISEQLRLKEKFTLAAFSGGVQSFSETLVRVSPKSLQSAWKWCSKMQCCGSTNILDALKFALSVDGVQGIYLLTDGNADMPEERLLDQIKLYKKVPIHTISFNCHETSSNHFLAALADRTAARYHVFRTMEEEVPYSGPQPYESPDTKLLNTELEIAQADLTKMTELRRECEILEWKGVKKTAPVAEGGRGGRTRGKGRTKKESDLESVVSSSGAFSARKWLKRHGLAAHKLTIMDALAPTVITQHPTYVDVLKKNVHAKVYDGVMPFAFLSSENPGCVSLVNPAAVDLVGYESKVRDRIAVIDKKIAKVVWSKLSDEDRIKFHPSNENGDPPGFRVNEELFRSVLERVGWPVSKKTVQLMCDEIDAGQLYLTQSEQLRQKPRKSPDTVDGGSNGQKVGGFPPKSDNFMLGYRVVAQNSVDGFYYPGTVIGNKGKGQCEVEFDDFDRQVVFSNSLIPTQGSTSRPKIKEGDYVLVQLLVKRGTGDMKSKLLAPGLIVNAADKGCVSFIILLFTGERLVASRHDLLKITKNRYNKTSQEIYQQLSRQRSSQRLRLIAEGQEDDGISMAGSLDEILKSNLILNKPMSVIGEDAKLDQMLDSPWINDITNLSDNDLNGDSNEGSNEDLDENEDEHFDKGLDEDLDVQSEVCEMTQMAKVTLECGLQVGGYDADAQTHISNDFWDDLEKVKYCKEDMVHESEILVSGEMVPVILPQIDIPVLKVSTTTPIQTDVLSISNQSVGDDQSVAFEENVDNTLSCDEFFESTEPTASSYDQEVNKNNAIGEEGVHMEGEVVLARWNDDGWYFRGKIVERRTGGFLVEDNGGIKEEIDLEHVFFNDKDNRNILCPGSFVIGLHPEYSFSYAPAQIISSHDDWFFSLRFYDQTEAEVPREELYFISHEQYLEDTKFIRLIEDSMLGSFAIVRDDTDGFYRRGLVTQATGRTFGISLNGETVVQDPCFVFGDVKKTDNVDLGCYCLCPADDLNNCFVPGTTISLKSGGVTSVRLYNGHVVCTPGPLYPINRHFYYTAVSFIASRDPGPNIIKSVV